MNTIAIVGAGLIGSSFGLAVRKAGFDGRILGVSSANALQAAISAGAVDEAASLEEACQSADLLYLSQPVDRILITIQTIAPLVKSGTFVTDAGSTKGAIVKRAGELLPDKSFLGGHPMAGKETRGAGAADASLFCSRPYILTPSGHPHSPHENEFRELLRLMGAIVTDLDANEHDKAVAFTSHLPQLLSTTLAATLQNQDNQYFYEVFGPGLIDMTRLALSPADLWASILSTNREQIASALTLYCATLERAKKDLLEGKFDALFGEAQRFATSIRRIPY